MAAALHTSNFLPASTELNPPSLSRAQQRTCHGFRRRPVAGGRAAVSRPASAARPPPRAEATWAACREASLCPAAPGNRPPPPALGLVSGDKTENKMVGKVMRDSWRDSLSFPFKDTASLSRPLSPPLPSPPDASPPAQARPAEILAFLAALPPCPPGAQRPQLVSCDCEDEDDGGRVSEASMFPSACGCPRSAGRRGDKGNGFSGLALMGCPEQA